MNRYDWRHLPRRLAARCRLESLSRRLSAQGSIRRASPLYALAASLTVMAGCADSTQHYLLPTAIERATTTLSLTSATRRPVRLYFDASGSMRGFGLAAAANTAGAGDAFGSLLDGVRALVRENDDLPAAEGSPRPPQVLLFGSQLAEQSSFDAIADAAVGRQAPPAGTVRTVMPSANCGGAAWNGAAVSRTNIDAMFGDAITCLDLVFRDVLANGRDRINIVVTDAEQNAPLNDRGCPNAQNAGTIQSYLGDWSRQGGVAAVIAFRLPYQSWRSTDTAGYCGCNERLLFAHVLAPFADDLDRVSTRIREAWRGAALPTFVPLNPRPAVSYRVGIVTESTPPDAMDFPSEPTTGQLEPPELSRLPQVWLVLRGEEGRLLVSIDEVAFATSSFANGPPIDWSNVGLEWRDPVPLTPMGTLDSPSIAGPLSFVQLAKALDVEQRDAEGHDRSTPATRRTARFLGAQREPKKEPTPIVQPLRLRIRRTQSSDENHCRWYLLEASAPARSYSDEVNRVLASLSSTACLNWNAVRAQMNSTLQAGPSLRLLLHIDYE